MCSEQTPVRVRSGAMGQKEEREGTGEAWKESRHTGKRKFLSVYLSAGAELRPSYMVGKHFD